MLTKEQLLGMTERRVERVELPGGGHTFVRTMSAHELDNYERALTKPVRFKDKELRRNDLAVCRYVAIVCCDEAGNRTFADSDVHAISEMRADVVKVIFDAGQALNDPAGTEKNS